MFAAQACSRYQIINLLIIQCVAASFGVQLQSMVNAFGSRTWYIASRHCPDCQWSLPDGHTG